MAVQNLKTSFTRRIAIVSAAVLLLFSVIVTIQAIWTHEAALQQGKLITKRLTEIHTDHIDLTLNAVDITLRGIVERQYYNSLFGQDLAYEVEQDFRKWIENSPQLSWSLMADAKGKVVLTSSKAANEEWANSFNSVSGQEFFKKHKRNKIDLKNSLGVTIGGDEGLSSSELIILSRSMYNFDGSFSGVVAAAIDASYFFDFFKSIEYGDRLTMGFFIGNEKLVLSSTENKFPAEFLNFSDEEKFGNLVDAEIKVITAVVESEDYFIAAQKIGGLPVFLKLAFDRNKILEAWRAERITDFVFFMLFIAFGAVLLTLVFAMAKQIKRAEESEQSALLANQAKSEFLAKMSHELRTPLNAIIGFSEMIDSGYFGPLNNSKQQERVHDINLCGNHLLQLINDILDYSKGEAGKLEIRDSDVGVKRLVDESIRMVQEKAKSKQIIIENNITEDLPRVIVDERKIKQILINLLANAIKFTNDGGSVSVSGEVLANNDVKISVADNGVGMLSEDIPTALSVFGQIKNRFDMEEEGTGLGLPLCKMLTELHGGVFELQSELEKGTTASFILPAKRVVS